MKTILFATGLLLIAGTFIGLRIHRNDRAEMANARQALEEKNSEIERLSAEKERLAELLKEARLSTDQLQELMRLRAETGELRRRERERQDQRKDSGGATTKDGGGDFQPQKPPQLLPQDQWTFAGYWSPQDALQSMMWSMKNGDVGAFLFSLTPEAQMAAAEKFAGKSAAEIGSLLAGEVAPLKALRLDRSKTVSDSEVTFVLYSSETDNGAVRTRDEAVLEFKRVGSEWKATGF